jgi:hypothetical protein
MPLGNLSIRGCAQAAVDTCGFVEKSAAETHLASIGPKSELQERGILLCIANQRA